MLSCKSVLAATISRMSPFGRNTTSPGVHALLDVFYHGPRNGRHICGSSQVAAQVVQAGSGSFAFLQCLGSFTYLRHQRTDDHTDDEQP